MIVMFKKSRQVLAGLVRTEETRRVISSHKVKAIQHKDEKTSNSPQNTT
jgi:hypothetical protein